jgi:isoleucyl-tRNA synthetase
MAGKCPNLNFLVFSTEPWTLTGCQGIAVSPNVNYSIVECSNGEQYVIASQRYTHYKEEFKKLGEFSMIKTMGDQLEGYKVRDPVLGKEIIVCSDNIMKASFGSGVTSVCPAHFVEDYRVAQVSRYC